MPVAVIDLPHGLRTETKKQLVKQVYAALHEAYLIPDNRILLREWSPEQTSQDGQLGAPFRPVVGFEVPPGLRREGKRRLVERVSSAIAEACELPRETVLLPSGKTVSTRWVLSFFREYPLELAALDDLMAFENPMVLESAEAAMQALKPASADCAATS
jgi:phenylpyruvate tautomerase PptA (4-oxalocrotonate tautomerase family)